MGTRHFCDGCDSDADSDMDLLECDGDCFEEFCSDCLKTVGKKRYCEDCFPEKVPDADVIDSPLLNPVPMVDWKWDWEKEAANA